MIDRFHVVIHQNQKMSNLECNSLGHSLLTYAHKFCFVASHEGAERFFLVNVIFFFRNKGKVIRLVCGVVTKKASRSFRKTKIFSLI